MKKSAILICMITFVFCAIFSSCKKYEEDYGIMWKTPKARLVGTWKITQVDTIIMSKYSMFGDLWMTFEKNGNGNIKFNDKGLGDAISNANLDAILGEIGSSDDIIGNVDFASLLKEETKFKWEFINKKNYLRFNIYDASADSYSSNIDMKILSLCKSDCKLRYEENSTKVEISMQK